MRIKELTINNFRSVSHIKLSALGNYLAISGRNNAGKTNLVSALFSALAPSDDDDYLYGGPSRRAPPNMKQSLPVWLRERSDGTDSTITVRLVLDTRPDVDMGIIRFLQTMGADHTIDLSGPVALTIELTSRAPDYKPEFSVYVGSVQLDAYRSGEVLRKLRSMEPFYYHNSVEMNHRYVVGQIFRELVGDSLQSRVSDFGPDWKALTDKVGCVLQDAQTELASLLGRLEDQFSLSLSIREQLSPAMLPLSVSLDDSTRPVPVEQWGSGTRNRTLILARLLNAIRRSKDENDIQPIIVVEEPESFLHPSAQADFGRVLQAISRDIGIQIIVTTHSPYLLSHQDPEANILLERRKADDINPTTVVSSQEDWIRPFELALGISSPELYGLKGVFFGEQDQVIFCEGPTDAKYLEFFKDARHGSQRLNFNGVIYPYGGAQKIQNQTLLKFIRDRFGKIVITVDLDLCAEVRNDVTKAGFVQGDDFLPIGLDTPGKRSIEGLVPQSIHASVFGEHPDLVLAMQEKGDKDAAKSARSRWKQAVLEKFLSEAQPGAAELGPFYELVAKINESLCGCQSSGTSMQPSCVQSEISGIYDAPVNQAQTVTTAG